MNCDWNGEAEKLVRAAEKSLRGTFFSNIFKSRSDRIESALEDYKKALDGFKLAGNWRRCRELGVECAALAAQIGDAREAAAFSADAADFAMKAGEPSAAVALYKEATEAHKKSGAFDAAAHNLRKLGEHFEKESAAMAAATYFKQSAELYALAKYHTTDATKLRVRAADILARMFDEPERLREAIEIYENVGEEYLSNNLLRFHAKDLFVKSVILFLLLGDDIGAQKSLDRYCGRDASLAAERRFVDALVAAFAARSAEAFEAAANQLARRGAAEPALRAMLDRARAALGEEVDADADPL